MSSMNDDIAIKVDGVYKDFKLPHEKANSIKSLFTGLGKKKRKGYEVQHALKDISFDVKKGEFFGIVGRNGSGKSTLLKIIAEIYRPTKGKVTKNGRLVPFIELGVGFNPELTGRENVYLNGALLGFSESEVEAMYDDIVQFAELERFMDQKLKNYSSGMQVRLAFSVATRANADILLIDEVLAVGDADFQRKCFNYFKKLKKDRTTVIFVSHDMDAIREFCETVVLIEKSKVVEIGSPHKISQLYSKLFIEGISEEEVELAFEGSNTQNRWGTNEVKFRNVESRVSDEVVSINTKIITNKNVDCALYGIHILSAAGNELVAVNNRMINKADLANLKSGVELSLDWSIMNVFNDGEYNVTLTLVSSNGDTYDWFEGAAQFRVSRTERSTTDILPPIEVTVKKGKP